MHRKPSRRSAVTACVLLLALSLTAVAAVIDSPGTISFTSGAYQAGEGAGGVSVTLTRTGGAAGEVKAKVSIAHGTTDANDFRKPGETDATFVRSASVESTFDDSLAIQPDGKILIGQPRTVRRLLSSGSLDPTFNQPVLNGSVHSVAVLPDGKILIAGGFTVANGEARGYVLRLFPDGTIDPSFNASPGLTLDDSPNVVAAAPDGKVMIGGYFTKVNNVARSHLARLNSDGTLDTGFNPDLRSNVYAMKVQPDGKVLAAGFGLFRYNTDGSADMSFNGGAPVTSSGAELALALRPDGKVLVSGNFKNVLNSPHASLVQLNTDGSLDSSFDPGTGPDFSIDSMALQPDGKLLIGGSFTVYNGAVRTHVARVNADGSVDTSFVPAVNDSDSVYSVRLQSDGKVVVGGAFAIYVKRLLGDIFVTWGDGDTADKTVNIPVADDLLDEPDETATLNVTPLAGGASTGAFPSATLTILDNDAAPAFTSGTPPPVIARVLYSHTFTASGSPAPTFSLAAGTLPPGLFLSSTGVLSGFVSNTGTYPGITVTASNGVAPAATQTFDLAVVSGGVLQFSAGNYSVAENGGGIDITVNRVNGSAGTATVNYSTSGVTASSNDFTPASGMLTFANGETSKTFTITVTNDDLYEGDETLNLFLGSAGGGGLLGNPTVATLTILNDDAPPSISIDDVTVTEGDSGTKQAVFTVTRTGATGRFLFFNARTADGTAVGGEDYVPLVQQFSISPSATTVTVPVTIYGDTLVEPDKSFVLNLSSPVDATIARGQGVVTIKDNDTTAGTPTVQLAAREFRAQEGAGVAVVTVTRSGDTSAPASVGYSTGVGAGTGAANDRGDYTVTFGTLRFAAGEASKTFNVFVTDDALVEGDELFFVFITSPTGGASLGAPSSANVRILDNDTSPSSSNPADDTAFFVRQHYRDFLNRDPDADGLAFWVGEIESCGADAQCREVKRVNVSAAFFLSIEFKETGYLVYLLHKAAFNTGERLALRTFMSDSQQIGRDVVVGAEGWESKLESNKQAFLDSFVTRAQFLALYPQAMTPEQYVDALNADTGDPLNPSAGGSLTKAERDALVADLSAGRVTRAQVLRAVAENGEFRRRHLGKAFVLMQYFGYLRRGPNETPDVDFTGYNFWLGKLNEFNGNFVQAEMVKAFLSSDEYRKRFGQ
jgi:uncharacterized delta-60 repeat protein